MVESKSKVASNGAWKFSQKWQVLIDAAISAKSGFALTLTLLVLAPDDPALQLNAASIHLSLLPPAITGCDGGESSVAQAVQQTTVQLVLSRYICSYANPIALNPGPPVSSVKIHHPSVIFPVPADHGRARPPFSRHLELGPV